MIVYLSFEKFWSLLWWLFHRMSRQSPRPIIEACIAMSVGPFVGSGWSGRTLRDRWRRVLRGSAFWLYNFHRVYLVNFIVPIEAKPYTSLVIRVDYRGFVEHGGPFLGIGNVPEGEYAIARHNRISRVSWKAEDLVVGYGPGLHLLVVLRELILHDVRHFGLVPGDNRCHDPLLLTLSIGDLRCHRLAAREPYVMVLMVVMMPQVSTAAAWSMVMRSGRVCVEHGVGRLSVVKMREGGKRWLCHVTSGAERIAK